MASTGVHDLEGASTETIEFTHVVTGNQVPHNPAVEAAVVQRIASVEFKPQYIEKEAEAAADAAYMKSLASGQSTNAYRENLTARFAAHLAYAQILFDKKAANDAWLQSLIDRRVEPYAQIVETLAAKQAEHSAYVDSVVTRHAEVEAFIGNLAQKRAEELQAYLELAGAPNK